MSLVWSWRSVVVGWVAAAALVVSLAVPAEARPAPAPPAQPASSAPSGPLVRPDAVSARVTARSTGQPVEVEALRDEFSSTWVNPDGTWTTRSHAGQQRFRDPATGAWREVDLDLTTAPDGAVVAKGHPGGLKLRGAASAGGDVDLVSVEHGAAKGKDGRDVPRGLALGWDKRLPAPVLDGARATYPEVAPGVDLVVEARRTGFEQFFVLQDRSAVPADGKAAWSFTVKTKGLSVRPDADGGISFVDAAGTVASRIPPAIAWDATVDAASGEHANVSSVRLEAVTKGTKTTITVVPDAAWLADPARVFPVTVDPTYAALPAVTPVYDAFVQTGIGSDQSASTELKLGTYNGGATVARSFLRFPMTTWKGYDVVSADLNLYATHSYSCSARNWVVWDTGTATTATTWAAQPNWNQTWATTSATKGYSSACAAGWTSTPMTALARAWAGNGGSENTMGIRAESETDSYGWKKFASAETATDPYLSITYNRKPGVALAPYNGVPDFYDYTRPGSTTPAKYTSYDRLWFRSKASDPDASLVKFTFEVHSSTTTSATTLKGRCESAFVAAGTEGTCRTDQVLADNALYYARAAVVDERGLWNGTWSPWFTFRTARAVPPAPTINCPDAANGSWSVTVPGGTGTCTITAAAFGTSAPAYVDVTIDGGKPASNYSGGPVGRLRINQSSDPAIATTTVTVNLSEGPHTITARSVSPTQILSTATTSYSFGFGSAAISAPATATATTTGGLRVTASGPPQGSAGAPAAKLSWRLAGTPGGATGGWTPGPDLSVTQAGGQSRVNAVWNTADATKDASGKELNARVPALLEYQVCFTYPSEPDPQCTWSTSPRSVLRLPHAFGGAYSTGQAGPGQVALWTGEFATDSTDVSLPGYNGSALTVGRSHASYAGAAGDGLDPVTGVFGPGWTANLDGTDAGAAGYQVIDSTGVDGTIALVDVAGETLVFRQPGGTRTPGKADTYDPVGEDTQQSLAKLTLTGTGTAAVLTLTEQDGTTTTWTPLSDPTTGTDTSWTPKEVTEPGQPKGTTFSRDSAGRVTRILAPVPDGVNCDSALVAGCRALHLTYGQVAGKTRLVKVEAEAFDPEKPGGADMNRVEVAVYGYDDGTASAGEPRLISATDPRSQLVTRYGYDGGIGRLATITPPGLAPYTLNYTATVKDGAERVRLTSVTRPRPATAGGGTATIASIVYDLDPTVWQSTSGLPDLRETTTSSWGQGEGQAPTYGAAVFAEDHPAPATTAEQVPAGDWAYADLSFTDALGRTVNTAAYGAGAWQITASEYDVHDNVVQHLDADALAAVRDQAGQPGTAVSPEALATRTVYNTEGTLVVDSYGPTRLVALPDGTMTNGRPRTHTSYNEGAPNGGTNTATGKTFDLPTTVQVTTVSADLATTLAHSSTTVTGYGDQAGWQLGQATEVTTRMGPDGTASPGDITRRTVYDAEGKVIESRQPASDGSDAGTTKTWYYTVGTHPGDPDCGNKPAWAGRSAARSRPPTPPPTGSRGCRMPAPRGIRCGWRPVRSSKPPGRWSAPPRRRTPPTGAPRP